MSRWIGKKLGTYRVLSQVRSTALDTVFKAYDEKLGRVVALQVWLPDVLLPPSLPDTLRSFTRLLTQLSHPNIGSLLDCEVYDGSICMAYDFVPVRALFRRFHQPRTWEQAAQMLAPVAQALAYAHRAGVIHGSLRPDQIILTADGSPVIFDFGIEMLIQQELARSTPESTWLGSDLSSYLAPERILGRRIDASADLYSLGMIIVAWMSDRRAYTAATPLGELLARYQNPTPPLKSVLPGLSGVPLQILTLVLQNDPRKRISSSNHFAVLLTKAALGQAIPRPLVTNPSWQPFRMQARHWWALVVLLVVGLMSAGVLWSRANPAQADALAMQIGLVDPTSTPRPTSSPVVLAQQKQQRSPTPTITATRQPTPTLTPLPSATPLPTQTPIDPYDLPFLARTPLPVTDEEITLLNAAKLVAVGRWGLGHSRAIAFSPDGARMAMATTTGVYLFDLPGFETAGYLNTAGGVNNVLYSPGGDTIFTAEESGLVRLWDARTHNEIAVLSGHALPVRHLAVSADGKWIASADQKIVYLWDAQEHDQQARLSGHTEVIHGLAFTLDGQTLLSVSADYTVRLWNVKDGTSVASYSTASGVLAVAVSPSGNTFYTAGMDRTIQVWKMGEKTSTLFARHNLSLTGLVVSPDGETIAASGRDGASMVWGLDGKTRFPQVTREGLPKDFGGDNYPHEIAFHPTSGHLASMLWDNSVVFYDVSTGQPAETLDKWGDFYKKVITSQDSRYLLAETIDGRVKVWDLPAAKLLFAVRGNLPLGRLVSKDSELFAVKSGPREVSVYWLKGEHAGEERYRFGNHTSVDAISFAENGVFLVSGSPGSMNLWSLVSGLKLQTEHNYRLGGCDALYTKGAGGPELVAFANRFLYIDFIAGKNDALCYLKRPDTASELVFVPDGNLAAANTNNTITVWDYSDSERSSAQARDRSAITLLTNQPQSETGKIVMTTILSKNKLVAAIFADGSLRVWDATASGAPLIAVQAHNALPTSLMSSPDGRFMISTAQDGTLRFWGVLP